MDVVRVWLAFQGVAHRVNPGPFLGLGTIVLGADDDIATGISGLLGDGGCKPPVRLHLLCNLGGRHAARLRLENGVRPREKARFKIVARNSHAHIDTSVRSVSRTRPMDTAWAETARRHFGFRKPRDKLFKLRIPELLQNFLPDFKIPHVQPMLLLVEMRAFLNAARLSGIATHSNPMRTRSCSLLSTHLQPPRIRQTRSNFNCAVQFAVAKPRWAWLSCPGSACALERDAPPGPSRQHGSCGQSQ